MKNREIKLHRLNKISGIVIVINALFIGLEANFWNFPTLIRVFNIVDIGFVVYFTIEIIFRLRWFSWGRIKHFFSYIQSKFKTNNQIDRSFSNIVNFGFSFFWLWFDLLLVFASIIAYGQHFIEHPEIILMLRMLRIFRIFRIFELSESLKRIEQKIIAVIPTISTFLILIFLVVYTYAVLGMNLYNFHHFKTIDFTNLYSAMMDLFLSMTNGWAGILKDLHTATKVNPIISDIYITSFFIFSVMITLNLFLAVMTSSIQDKMKEDKHDDTLVQLNKKLEHIEKSIKEIKKNITPKH